MGRQRSEKFNIADQNVYTSSQKSVSLVVYMAPKNSFTSYLLNQNIT